MASRAAERQYSFLLAILGLLALMVLLPVGAGAVPRAPGSSPSSVTPAPTSDDLVQRCVEQELVSPTVTKAELYEPGKQSQSEVLSMDVAATPDECHGVVERMVQFEVTKNELRRINGKLRRQVIRMLWFGYDGYRREVAGPMGISGAANPHRPDWVYYHCSVGRAVTKVRLKMRVNNGKGC